MWLNSVKLEGKMKNESFLCLNSIVFLEVRIIKIIIIIVIKLYDKHRIYLENEKGGVRKKIAIQPSDKHLFEKKTHKSGNYNGASTK